MSGFASFMTSVTPSYGWDVELKPSTRLFSVPLGLAIYADTLYISQPCCRPAALMHLNPTQLGILPGVSVRPGTSDCTVALCQLPHSCCCVGWAVRTKTIIHSCVQRAKHNSRAVVVVMELLRLAGSFRAAERAAAGLIPLLQDRKGSFPNVESLTREISSSIARLKEFPIVLTAGSTGLSSNGLKVLLEISESLQQVFQSLVKMSAENHHRPTQYEVEQHSTRIKVLRNNLSLILQ